MYTIHSSSLAYRPTSYVKPGEDSFNKKSANTKASDITTIANRSQIPASTPEQIKTALAKSGLNSQDSFNHTGNTRNLKALQAYNQTLNHPIQTQLENIISRVDYYA